MSSNKKSTLPMVEQFRRGVEELLLSLNSCYDLSTNEEYLGVAAYVDPVRRVTENLPPFYALLPLGAYEKSMKPSLAEKDKLCGGGVVYSDKSNEYEIVRVDYFSKPDVNSIQKKLHENGDSIFDHYVIDATTRVAPGFCIESIHDFDEDDKKIDLGPIGVKILSNKEEIMVNTINFSCKLDGVFVENCNFVFDDKMAKMFQHLNNENTKNVFKSASFSKMLQYDEETQRNIPLFNISN